jgi:two-component system NarL family sensor kinase
MEEWQKPETITLWILITVLFTALLLIFILVILQAYFKKVIRTKAAEAKAQLDYQQEILETTIRAQEIERERIAADLHDTIIGKLTVIQMRQEMGAKNDKTNRQLLTDCIDTTRRISHDLSPPLMEETPLPELLQDVFHAWEERLDLKLHYDCRLDIDYPVDFKIQLLRIAQEVLTNISKHANAKRVLCHLRITKTSLSLMIKDWGKGFSMDQKYKGLGLKNIESRVSYLRGCYHVKSKPGSGTQTLLSFKNP